MPLTDWLTKNLGLITGLVGLITIVAIVLAPILALRLQSKIEIFRERNTRKLNIFKVLMATRAARLSERHVEALNMIDIEFHDNKEVINSWRNYHSHLSSFKDIIPPNETNQAIWANKIEDLLIDLLSKMSQAVGYSFDEVTLKRGIYTPKAHGELANEQELIRKGLLKIILGEQAIAMKVVSLPSEEKSQKEDVNLNKPHQ
jgi:hypothetical protein